MPQGLQIWNAAGDLVFDIGDRIMRMIGSFETGGSAGSLVEPGFAAGTPWAFATVPSTGGVSYGGGTMITFSGTTMSWEGGWNVRIIYGVY